jgi:hypothetical protein
MRKGVQLAVKHDLFGLQTSHDFIANIYVSIVNIPNLETHSYWAGISLQTLNP